MNKIVFNYMDMRAISILKRGNNLLDRYIKSESYHKDEETMFLNSTIRIIEVMKQNLDKKNLIYENNIKNAFQILLNKQDFKLDTYKQALEEFIGYLDNISNNFADENDNTLGREFNLNVYNKKFNAELNLNIVKINEGWRIYNSELDINSRCNKFCEEELYNLLDNFAISYPNDLSGYFKWLWEASTVYNYTEKEVCEEFKEISKWINLCNDYSPNTLLGGYK